MAEVNKNYKEMWSMLATADEEWANQPSAETLASNVFFHSLMNAVNNLVRASSDYTLTDKERKDLLKEMNTNITSADWVAKLYTSISVVKDQSDTELEEEDK